MMVKKRGPLDRIEKVVKKRQSLNSVSDTSSVSSPKERNMLNDHLLNLYKAEIPSHPESSAKSDFPTPDDDKLVQNDGTGELKKNSNSVESSRSQRSKSTGKRSTVFTLKNSALTFKDVGGLDEVLFDVLDIFLPLRDPEVFANLGNSPTNGFLLHGPPGCGKTHLARAIAGELGLPYIEVAATELVCGISGESESKIRDLFDEAIKNGPCILFLDEIDAICSKREVTERGMERRMVTQLFKCLDELKERNISSSVIVIGATNRPDSIDPALRRGCRFETEFAIGMPDENARFKILQVLCQKLKLSPEFDMSWLAHHTPGYLGADLEGLIRQAVRIGIKRIYRKIINKYIESQGLDPTSDSSRLPKFDSKYSSENSLESVLMWYKSNWKIPEEELEHLCFELQDFQDALRRCVPYSKREGFATVPDVTWDDVGALEKVKKELQEAILWPVKYGKLYENADMTSTKGIILYGPKGCGKTLLAKAIANECSINFISVKGPELLSMYLGESEKSVRQCFQRARNSAPCVIFFDELDALCPTRSGSNTNAAAERVVNQMLAEMDGLEERKQVFVIGATNRIEKIDSAMLRPGRLEKRIYVDLPSPEDRIEILKSLTKNKTRPKLTDDVNLEQICFDSRCESFSGADMAYLLRAAFAKAIEEHIDSPNSSPDDVLEVNMKHFEHALSIVKPSVSEKDKKYFQRSLV